MSAQTIPLTVRPRPVRVWRTTLRLQRGPLVLWAVVVTGVSGILLWAYGPGASAARAALQNTCTATGCDWSAAVSLYELAYTAAEIAIGVLPYLAAAWAGAVVGRELESGTAHLAWTQSIPPARWLAGTLAVPGALLTAGTTVLVLLHRLLFDANKVPVAWNWWNDATYNADGPVAVAHVLLGLAVGALAALLLRRALPALGAGIVVTAALVAGLFAARPHLWAQSTSLGTLVSGPRAPSNVLLGDEGAVTSTGAHIADPGCGNSTRCLKEHDITGYFSHYHPAAHFWPLQLVETGILLAATALLLAAAFTVLRRRTA
ncbi:hypothetical protein [Streptomyces sp. NPDC005538]|uniref:hypothetical protein n=1 Tax=unclassified Streptomyces TaxID=2593676 RepID=UPI0033B27DE6